MVAATVAQLGAVDVAFANAGVSEQSTPLLDATLEEWQRVIDVDLTVVFLTVRAAARVMVPRGRGKIVSTASIYGFVGSFLGGQGRAYAAAKAGVVNFTRSVAIELAPHNIQVNAIAPTFTRTGLGRGLLLGDTDEGRALIARIEERTPIGRVAQPDDLRGAAIFLVSAASNLVTGHTLVVDGGWLAW